MKYTNAWIMLITLFFGISVQAKVVTVKSVDQFKQFIEDTPISVVLFYNSYHNPRSVRVIFEKVSRDPRYKEAKLAFVAVDTNRYNLANLLDVYAIDKELPHVQIFLCNRPKRNAFMNGCFTCDQLKRFIERFIGRDITNEINRKKIQKQFALAQAKRPYYAADYYNPFYMMPWYNYTPPADWPDQGPEWVGIDIE